MKQVSPDGLDRKAAAFGPGRFRGWLAARLASGSDRAVRRTSALVCWAAAMAAPPLTVLFSARHEAGVVAALLLAALPGCMGVSLGAATLRRVRSHTARVLLQVGASKRTAHAIAGFRVVVPAVCGAVVGVLGLAVVSTVVERSHSPMFGHRRLLTAAPEAWLIASLGCVFFLGTLALAAGFTRRRAVAAELGLGD